MILPLRRVHLRVWIVLAVLLPVLLVAGLLVRCDTTPANAGLHWDRYK